MASSKHLKELLNEDQEPFVLKKYIDAKLYQSLVPNNNNNNKHQLQIKKRKPISENLCFFSSSTCSPHVKKSPLFDFRSPAKSPCRNSSTLFVHIPAKTAAMLLEAAFRIQKKKAKSRKSIGFGLFGSILKRITNRKKNQKNECSEGDKRLFVKDIIRWDSLNSCKIFTADQGRKGQEIEEDKMVCEIGLSGSCTSTSRFSSVWSESNEEEKSFDLETSTSRSEVFEDMEETKDVDFCSSPFQFVPQNNALLSPCLQSPKFDTFPSPNRISQQAVDNDSRTFSEVGNKYEEEDKEQNSPVSVFDPPFEDDDDQDDEVAEKDCFELEHSFANVQRAKQQLLHKLRRFERLAELDPIALEKRIAEQEDEDSVVEEPCDNNDGGAVLSVKEKVDFVFVRELLTESNMYRNQIIPSDMKRLVLDLVYEEWGEETNMCSMEFVAEKVCKKLESWKEVDSNTIDMMVEFDFRRDTNEWAHNPEQMQDVAVEIELAIFGLLVDELSGELVQCSSL